MESCGLGIAGSDGKRGRFPPLSGPELLLSLAALITIANLQRRSRKFFRGVGLTVLVLIVGTLLGGLASSGLAGSGLPIPAPQLAALPTLILLAALSVLVD